MKNKPNFFLITGVSQTGGVGGEGPPLGNFSHIIPFFSLMATLSSYKQFWTLSAINPVCHCTLCMRTNLLKWSAFCLQVRNNIIFHKSLVYMGGREFIRATGSCKGHTNLKFPLLSGKSTVKLMVHWFFSSENLMPKMHRGQTHLKAIIRLVYYV